MDLPEDEVNVPLVYIIFCNIFGVSAGLCLVLAKLVSLTTKRGSSILKQENNNDDPDEEADGIEAAKIRENEIRHLGFMQFLSYGVAAFNKWKATDFTWGTQTATSPIYDVGLAAFCSAVYFVTSTRKCSLKALCQLRSLIIIGGLLVILAVLIILRVTGVYSDEIHVALVCTKFFLTTLRRNFVIWKAYTGSKEWKPRCVIMDTLEFFAGVFGLLPLILMSAYLGDGRPWEFNYPRAVMAIPAIIVNLIFFFLYHLPSRRNISPEHWYSTAETQFRRSDFNECLRTTEAILAKDPEHVGAKILMETMDKLKAKLEIANERFKDEDYHGARETYLEIVHTLEGNKSAFLMHYCYLTLAFLERKLDGDDHDAVRYKELSKSYRKAYKNMKSKNTKSTKPGSAIRLQSGPHHKSYKAFGIQMITLPEIEISDTEDSE